MDIAT
jgi:hypothetical protein